MTDNPECFDAFDEMLLAKTSGLLEVQESAELKQMRLELNAQFALGTEEFEEPEED